MIALVVAAVVGAWTVLLGAAYLARTTLGMTGRSSAAIVLVCYVCLALAAVIVLGPGWQGCAGAAGMLLPCAVALVVSRR